jgi:hypothetical protein
MAGRVALSAAEDSALAAMTNALEERALLMDAPPCSTDVDILRAQDLIEGFINESEIGLSSKEAQAAIDSDHAGPIVARLMNALWRAGLAVDEVRRKQEEFRGVMVKMVGVGQERERDVAVDKRFGGSVALPVAPHAPTVPRALP